MIYFQFAWKTAVAVHFHQQFTPKTSLPQFQKKTGTPVPLYFPGDEI